MTTFTGFVEIEAYKTPDGKIFESKKAANEHYENLLGEELDGLLKLFKLDIERSREYKVLLQLLGNKAELKKQIAAIHRLLENVAGE